MASCIRCREELSLPNANYCGECGFPILNDSSEEEVRTCGKEEFDGFLGSFDIQTIIDSIGEDQEPPGDAYQWYLEEGVKMALVHLALLHRWEWFDEERVPALFFSEALFEEDPPEEAFGEFILWGRLWGFLYKAHGPALLELGIKTGALFSEELLPDDDIDVVISIEEEGELPEDDEGE